MRTCGPHPELRRLRRLGLSLLAVLGVLSLAAVLLLSHELSRVLAGVGQRFGERTASAVSRELCAAGACLLLRPAPGAGSEGGQAPASAASLERDARASGAAGLVVYDSTGRARMSWNAGSLEIEDVPASLAESVLDTGTPAIWSYVATRSGAERATSRAQATLFPFVHHDHRAAGDGGPFGVIAVHHDLEQLAAGERRLRWAVLAGVILMYAASSLVFLLALGRARRALESRIRESVEARTQLVESEKLATIGEVISSVAHELNNPLTTVVAHSELLSARLDDPEDRELTGTLLDASQRCRAVVRNLLDFARRDAQARVELNVAEIVERTRRLIDHQLRAFGIVFESRISKDLPLVIGDPNRVGQVLLNLLVNGMQAMEQAGVRGRLMVTARPDAGSLLLEVEDEGPGVDARIIEQIFEPFFTTKPAETGTGLGLPVCRQIVEEAGGQLDYLVRPGGGALFRVTLPGERVAAERPAAEPEPCDAALPPLTAGLSILVVDDDGAARGTAVEILRASGARAREAADPARALSLIESDPPDVVISDLRLGPQHDGVELLREVKLLAPDVGLLLLTGQALDAQLLARIDGDGIRLLTKPYGVRELVDAVESLGRGVLV